MTAGFEIPTPTPKEESLKPELSLFDLDEKQFRASLASLVLTKSAWSCLSIHETSKLLRPLQICPDLTGTSVLSQDATAEITYKFMMGNGRIGVMTAQVSIEDFRADKLGGIYNQLHIPQIKDVFMDTIIIQIVDHLKPIFAREYDQSLWQETIAFLPQDLRHEHFLTRGLRLEAIPRSFYVPLQRAYDAIMKACKEQPNVAFQVCLRAYLEYNELENRELLSTLLSKYFYTVFRHHGIETSQLFNQTIPTFSLNDRRQRFKTLSRLLTVDNDSDTALDSLNLRTDLMGINYNETGYANPNGPASPDEVHRLRLDVVEAQTKAETAHQIVAQYQEENKQELIKRLSDPDKFLFFSITQFFEDVFDNLPQGVKSDYGAAWIPKTALLDEVKRESFTQHLKKISHENYLFDITTSEATIIGYWRILADSFYNQWVLNQYKQLQGYEIKLEDSGITILNRDQFIEEVQLRFAARHLEIVVQNQAPIANIVVYQLAKRISINTTQQTFQAMRAKLASVLDMDISRNDVREVKRLIDTFTEVFMGKKEVFKSPYPVGTILETRNEIASWRKDSRTRIGMEILSQIYRDYMA